MSFEFIFVVLLSFTYLFVAYLSIAKNKSSLINNLFFLLTFLLCFWSLSSFLEDAPLGGFVPELFLRLELALGILISFVFLSFSIYFPKKVFTINKVFLFLGGLTTIVFSIASFTPNIVNNVRYSDGIIFTDGPLLPYYGFFAAFNFIAGTFFLLKKYGKLNYQEKQQSLYLAYGFSISSIIAVFFNLIIPNIPSVPGTISRIGIYGNIILVLTVSYAIIKHRLLDIKLIVARTVTYSLLVVIVSLFYIGSAILIGNTFLKTNTTSAQLIEFTILTIIVAFTFQPLRKFLEKSTDKIFFKQDYDSNQLLSALTKVMAETILIDDIAHNLLKHLIAEMRITRGAFVLTDGGKIFVTETQGFSKEPVYSEKDVFSIQALDKILIFEEIDEGPIKDLMRKLDVTVVIPLKTQVDHVGILLLGEKASGEIYSQKDVNVLEIFTPEAAISFENAKSVEKIRRFNITLKEQVERATKDLRSANAQLKDLDKLKDEFLSIASHDLRTPMTAIKGYLWMALNGRAGKIQNDALKRYLDISYASSERMISLINDLLNVSRIKAGRMQMIFEDIDFKTIVDQVFAELTSKATEKNIELNYKADKTLPHVIADKQKLAEVLQNLVGNALKFTPEKGKITIAAKTKGKQIQIDVTDTGVGLSKEDSAKLFEKYSRVEQSYAAAKTTGGTGLGLYITKNYIEMHGGKIWLESQLGKGTTFSFTLKEFDKNEMAKMNQTEQKNEGAANIPAVSMSTAKEVIAGPVPASISK